MKITNNQEARAVGKYFAEMALDLGRSDEIIDSARDNLIDTLNDEGFSEWVNIAIWSFDDVVAK